MFFVLLIVYTSERGWQSVVVKLQKNRRVRHRQILVYVFLLCFMTHFTFAWCCDSLDCRDGSTSRVSLCVHKRGQSVMEETKHHPQCLVTWRIVLAIFLWKNSLFRPQLWIDPKLVMIDCYLFRIRFGATILFRFPRTGVFVFAWKIDLTKIWSSKSNSRKNQPGIW